jgi:hypothetical protein
LERFNKRYHDRKNRKKTRRMERTTHSRSIWNLH